MDKKRRATRILKLAVQQSDYKETIVEGSTDCAVEDATSHAKKMSNVSIMEVTTDHDSIDENSHQTPVFTELQPMLTSTSLVADSDVDIERSVQTFYATEKNDPFTMLNIFTTVSDAELPTHNMNIQPSLANNHTDLATSNFASNTTETDESTLNPSNYDFNTNTDITITHDTDLPTNILKESDEQQPSSSKHKRRKRKVKDYGNKNYLDYLSDDEDMRISIFGEDQADSDVWEADSDETDDDEDNENNESKNRSQKQKKIKQVTTTNFDEEVLVGETGTKTKKKNNRNERKKLKQSGQEYARVDGSIVSAKKLQLNPCQNKKCGNDCGSISEERRHQIFEHYWKLSAVRRKDWLVSLCQKTTVKRKRSTESVKRNFTFKYFINEGEGKRQVCAQFLAATVDISQKLIYYTASNARMGSAKEDLRGKCEPPNKTKESTKNSVMNFIKSLPAMPSHYCRRDSSRIYLPQEFKNVSNLYNIYKKRYVEEGIDVVSERLFRIIFNDSFNIGFHVPKKDKCLKCLKFERSDQNDPNIVQEKEEHEIEKKHSYSRFETHQNIHKSDPSTLCTSFDLQKVLNTPHGDSMLLYYSRKLAVYNLCFYESGTRKVYCFYWDESNGKRGANDIATILNKYINIVDERGTVKNLLLYCDCCPGQNRNRVILAMIHSTLQNCKNIETIQINFLLTGHTYMPVDSVHSVIEKTVKRCIIYAPSQWFTVFTTARQEPHAPYEVELMTYKDFFKWDVIGDKYFKGNLVGKISKIRVATFKKKETNKMHVKYSMNDSAESHLMEVQLKTKCVPTACYHSPLPISKAKFDDLQKLCKDKVIPPPFHCEYLNILCANNVKDSLPDTDIEDDCQE